MKTEVRDGRKMLVFDDCEEMKWYYHRKMCRGEILESKAMYIIEYCLTVEKANKYFEDSGESCRVKKPREP